MIKKPYLKVVLLASLLLNVFFIGIVISVFIYKNQMMKLPPDHLYDGISYISEEYRPQVQAVLDDHVPQMKENFYEIFKMMQGMRQDMMTPNFDQRKIQEFTRDAAQRHQDMGAIMGSMMTEITTILPEEERIIYVQNSIPEFPPFGPFRQIHEEIKKQTSE